MNVLVLDDEPRYREYIKHFLERKGFRAHLAARPDEAKQIVKERELDLMIVDIRLSDAIDGLDFADWVRELGHNLPLIVITGYSSPTYECRSRELGALAYLEKPIELNELYVHVQRTADRRGLLREIHRLEQELAAAQEGQTARRVLSVLPVACLDLDGAVLLAGPETRFALNAVADPELPRPLERVDAELLHRLRDATDASGAGHIAAFRRDGVASHYAARVRATELDGREAIAVFFMEAEQSMAPTVDDLWPGILLRAAQVIEKSGGS